MTIYRAEQHKQVDLGWLRSKLHFSFGDYFDEQNTAFGVMRVCNDDEIDGGKGFGPHPHSDMEIISVVLEGAIRHVDNLGNDEVTTAGGIQRMSAGSGIIHGEYNASDNEKLRLLQMWFMPAQKGTAPSFETSRYDQSALEGQLLAVVSPEGGEQAASIGQDLTVYLGRLKPGQPLVYNQSSERRAYVLVIEGQLQVNEQVMETGDAARLEHVTSLTLQAGQTDNFVMVIDLPQEDKEGDRI